MYEYAISYTTKEGYPFLVVHGSFSYVARQLASIKEAWPNTRLIFSNRSLNRDYQLNPGEGISMNRIDWYFKTEALPLP